MMRLGRPEHPASSRRKEKPEETEATEETQPQEISGLSILLDRLKTLWNNRKEDQDSKTGK